MLDIDETETNLLTADVAEETATEEAIATDSRPAGLPDKFWDAKNQAVRIDALVKSYLALEQKLSQMVAAPQCEADRQKLFRLLGQPESPDGYTVDVSHGLFETDAALNAKLHGLGFTPEQVQAVYDVAAEKLVPLILDVASEFQADRELDRLVTHFGGASQWQEVSRQLLAYGRKHLAPDVLKGLSSSYEGVISLYRMMQAEGSGVTLRGEGGEMADAADTAKKLMRDPKYWRDRDPTTIAKVTAAFEDMYG